MEKPIASLLQKSGKRIQDFVKFGNELLAHLHYDAGVNNSKFTDSPFGRIILKSGQDSLYSKLVKLTTGIASLTRTECEIADQIYQSKVGADEFQAYAVWLKDVGCLAAYESIYPNLFQTPKEAETYYDQHRHEGVPYQIVKVNVAINVVASGAQ